MPESALDGDNLVTVMKIIVFRGGMTRPSVAWRSSLRGSGNPASVGNED
jgi:hypothetical protein